MVGSLAEACGIPFDPNEPTQRGENEHEKRYPVGGGTVHVVGRGDDDMQDDDDDEYDDDDFIPAT